MRKLYHFITGIFLTAFVIVLHFVPQRAFATPALPVDREEFSIGDTITAEISAYGVKSTHTGYKENEKESRIFYTREGRADPVQPLRFVLTARHSLEGASQEVEFTVQPYEEMNRYAGKKMEAFHRKIKGTAGKRLNANLEYKVPPKARMLVVTVQLKDYYKKGNKVLPRHTTVEYELRVIGFAEASANPLRNKEVKVERSSKGKRIIIQKKGTDAMTAAIGIGVPLIAAFAYWLLYRRKKK